MKKYLRFFVFMLAAVFVLAACDSSGSGDDDDGALVISGTLTNSGQSPVSAADRTSEPRRAATPGTSQTFRAEVASDNSITGKLKDDAVIFELTGSYEPVSKTFSMQAVSSFIIFSIEGKLSADDTVDTDTATAFIAVKENEDWTRVNCTVASGSQTIDEEVNNTETAGVTVLPSVLRKTWTEQFAEIGGYSRQLVITQNSISQFIDGEAKGAITVLEVTNADGSPASEKGPWKILLMTKYRNHEDQERVEYIGKFFISMGITGPMAATGDQPVNDLYFGEDVGEYNDKTLNQVPIVPQTLFVFPYVGTSGVLKAGDSDWIWPIAGGYSPLFATTAAAKAATTIKAFSNFSFFLK